MNIRRKVTFTYVVLIILGVFLVSILCSWQIKKYLDSRIATSLHSQVDLVAMLFEGGKLRVDSTASSDQELRRVAGTLGFRLSVVRKDGIVLFDSDVPRDSLNTLENHSSRPEIVHARTEGIGTDLRRSHTIGQDFMYTARRIVSPSLAELDSGYVRVALPLTEVALVNNHVQKIIWAVGLLTVLISAVVSYQVSKRITRPILGLARTAGQIRQGNLGQRAAVTSHDEIGALGDALNAMAEKLSSDIGRMKKLEQVRSEFLGNVSHELRTPIFSIQGFLETLLDGAIDDPAVNREFLERAHRQATRLNDLLNDLIDISRIESGDMKMSFRYFPLEELLSETMEEMQEQAEKKQIRLTCDVIPPMREVYGDRARLKQVLVNLVDNALKYTGEGGKVECRARLEGNRCVVEVEDNGPGIAEEHLERVFERFYRVDHDRSREAGGTGLGLAIVKHIVEAHDSSVNLRSQVGKGSTFSFTLNT
jgi:two-component system, OmpR family, phosphate regulon sensor histidine kinase PhoR